MQQKEQAVEGTSIIKIQMAEFDERRDHHAQVWAAGCLEAPNVAEEKNIDILTEDFNA